MYGGRDPVVNQSVVAYGERLGVVAGVQIRTDTARGIDIVPEVDVH